jgi:hypothetical protein
VSHHCTRPSRSLLAPQEAASSQATAPQFPPIPRGLGFDAAPGVERAHPVTGFDCSREVMLAAEAQATVPVSHLSDGAAYAAWPVITVGTIADLLRGHTPPGLIACDITRRTAMGNPFKMGRSGQAYHLAPDATRAYSRLLREPGLDVDALASLTPGLVAAAPRSDCRCPTLRDSAICELVSLVEDGAKLVLTCCGLKNCHGIPLGRHVLGRASRGPDGDLVSPAAQADALLSSLAPVRPQGARRALRGDPPDAVYVECPHGFIHLAGPVDESMQPVCTIPECVQDAVEWWERFRPSGPGPSELPFPTCPPGQLFRPAALGLPPTGTAPAALTPCLPARPPPSRLSPDSPRPAPHQLLQRPVPLCDPVELGYPPLRAVLSALSLGRQDRQAPSRPARCLPAGMFPCPNATTWSATAAPFPSSP